MKIFDLLILVIAINVLSPYIYIRSNIRANFTKAYYAKNYEMLIDSPIEGKEQLKIILHN